jgi:hypothetical protein
MPRVYAQSLATAGGLVTGLWPPRCLGVIERLSGCFVGANRGTGADRGAVQALIGVQCGHYLGCSAGTNWGAV